MEYSTNYHNAIITEIWSKVVTEYWQYTQEEKDAVYMMIQLERSKFTQASSAYYSLYYPSNQNLRAD
jgi:cephalosporin-C deacetylase-like acetyl esterase